MGFAGRLDIGDTEKTETRTTYKILTKAIKSWGLNPDLLNTPAVSFERKVSNCLFQWGMLPFEVLSYYSIYRKQGRRKRVILIGYIWIQVCLPQMSAANLLNRLVIAREHWPCQWWCLPQCPLTYIQKKTERLIFGLTGFLVIRGWPFQPASWIWCHDLAQKTLFICLPGCDDRLGSRRESGLESRVLEGSQRQRMAV